MGKGQSNIIMGTYSLVTTETASQMVMESTSSQTKESLRVLLLMARNREKANGSSQWSK
jgi:hypothetical protein